MTTMMAIMLKTLQDTVGRLKFGPQKFRTKIEICDFSVEIFGPKIICGFEIFGQKLSKIQNFDKVRHGQ